MYLTGIEFVERRDDGKTDHIANPTRPPIKVLVIRAVKANMVSPRNRAMVCWARNIAHINLFSVKGSDQQR